MRGDGGGGGGGGSYGFRVGVLFLILGYIGRGS